MGKSKYTPEHRAEVKRLYASGVTRAEIASATGMGLSSVHMLLGRRDVNGPRPVYTAEQHTRAMELHAAGLTVAKIARLLEVGRDAVAAWVGGRSKPLCLHDASEIRSTAFIPKTGYEVMSAEKAYVLGVVCGDGSICKPGTGWMLQLMVIDQDFIDAFAAAVKVVYGYDAQVKTYPKKGTTKGEIIRAGVCSRRICEDLLRYLPTGQGCREWSVPAEISSGSEAECGAFLRGFFDSKGSVGKKGDLTACSINDTALRQVEALLASLGIASIVATLPKHSMSILRVANASRRLFLDKVGFSIARKQRRLEEVTIALGSACERLGVDKIGRPLRAHHVKYTRAQYDEAMRLRKEGLTLKAVAAKLGIKSKVTIFHWEKGVYDPPSADDVARVRTT